MDKRVIRQYREEEIEHLKPTIPRIYPAEHQARKLYTLLTNCYKNKTASITFGALDPVQVIHMAEFLSTIYVSGWQSSSTASTTNEPGPDLADYPYNTVPNKVDQLFKAQEFHDVMQKTEKFIDPKSDKKMIDYMTPIIADADTGHGGLTAVMKLTKLFIEAGAAGIHLEDQRGGVKKCGHLGGKVLVSINEHIKRLEAARLQADIMNVPLVIIARTDAESAQLIDSNADEKDHGFILGFLRKVVYDGKRLDITEEKPITIFNAVKKIIKKCNIQIDDIDRRLRNKSYQDVIRYVKNMGIELDWDPEILRTEEGFYQVDGGVDYCIHRAIYYAPYCDLIWMETSKPNYEEAQKFSQGVKKLFPHKMLAYNLSPSFNWSNSGMSDEEIYSFSDRIAKLGFVWQFITLAGFHTNALACYQFAKKFTENKMLAYVENVQRLEQKFNVPALTHQKWSGAQFIDHKLSMINGNKSTKSMKNATENQFQSKL